MAVGLSNFNQTSEKQLNSVVIQEKLQDCFVRNTLKDSDQEEYM